MSVTHIPGPFDRAVELLARLAREDDPLSRINIINSLGGIGHSALRERRGWAEAWELLRRAGLICPEAGNPRDGDWWFVTSAGRHALTHDPTGTIQQRLPGG